MFLACRMGMDVQEDTPRTSSGTEPAEEIDVAGIADQIPGGRYHIVERLSTGAIGAVYKALDTILDRPVAVKCVRLDTPFADQTPDELRERFVREARIAARLQHPNIVTIHDIVATPDRGYIIMEFIEGRTLESLVESERRLPLTTATKILSQLASALDYAHERNVVHRDVKPSNILVAPSMYVWVTDFGIAKSELSTNLTMAGGVLGTPDYMSPEQAKGEDVDARSDLFSLGCILFECVVGEKPFRSPSLTGVLLSIINDEPVFPLNWRSLGLPMELKPILHHALEKERDKRFVSGAELMDALENLPSDAIAKADAALGTASSDTAGVKQTEEKPRETPVEARHEDAPVETLAEAHPADEDAAADDLESASAVPAPPAEELSQADAEPGETRAENGPEASEDVSAQVDEASSVPVVHVKPANLDIDADAAGALDPEEELPQPRLVARAVVEEPAPVEEPKAEEPEAEEPKVEEPKAEEPKVEEPKAEEPKVEEPKVEEPKLEEPKTEERKHEAPEARETPEMEPPVEETGADALSISAERIRALKDESQVLHLSPTLSADLQGVEISPEEGFLLSRIDGASRPSDIMSVSPMPEGDTVRALLDLLEKELIRLGGVTTEPGVAREPTPKTQKTVTPQPDAAIVTDVERLLGLAKAKAYPALLGLSSDAPEAKRKSAYLKIVAKYHPDRYPTADKDLREKLSSLCASASEAVTDFEQATKVKEEPKPTPVRTNGNLSGSSPQSVDDALSAAFDKKRHARELYGRALTAFDKADYWDAIQLGRQAIEADEQEADYYGLLGRALLQNKKWRKEAADNFLKASELQPNNIEYVGLLGAIYQTEGLSTRANAMLKRAQALDPEYELPELDAEPDLSS